MKKYAYLLIAVTSLIGLSAYQSATTSAYEDVSEEYVQYYGQWKNLKVLSQDITKDSLMGIMRGFNKALGVKCNHCHVSDKSSDEKHEKDIARKMMQMTREINEVHFAPIGNQYAQAIECATCHRGAAKSIDDTKKFMSEK